MKNISKKKKILIYFLSGLVPLTIFFVCAWINGYLPFGEEMLNAYDSFTQYSGMLLEYGRMLRSGNLFYSFGAGLGFNFLGTITYYGASPLNLFSLFASPSSYPYFIAVMTYLRVFLLGISMCFYLSHTKTKPLYTVMFSTIFALMGYVSSYYYNFLWIDSIIMLPLVIYGLDKIIENKKPTFYIVSLTITILINYYIGYMICIFSLVYFIYKIICSDSKDKKIIIKTFIISSILCGLMSLVVILPSYFALKTGKAELFQKVDYSGVNSNSVTFLYTFMSGTFQTGDQSYGPAQVYSSIMVFVLTIFYFFNTKFSKKEKIATAGVIGFMYLSFVVNVLNFAWQFFQRPIWWQSRFSFVFSFFIIILAHRTLMNIDKCKIKTSIRILLTIGIGLLIAGGAYYKLSHSNTVEVYTYFYLFLSALIFIEMMFLIDKKYYFILIVLFTGLDLTVNCYNGLKTNYRGKSITNYVSMRENLPDTIDKLDKENEYFYRFELMDDYTSDDGLYFGFNGINYFNSVRNIKIVKLMDALGLSVSDQCHFILKTFNPVILSTLNIKYLYGKLDYFKNIEPLVYENPYPLSIGFIADKDIKDLKLSSENTDDNINNYLDALYGEDLELYEEVGFDEFVLNDAKYDSKDKKVNLENGSVTAKYEFTSDGHYLLMPSDDLGETIKVNDKDYVGVNYYPEINKGDKVTIIYNIYTSTEASKIQFKLLDLDVYEKAMKKLSTNMLKAKTNVNNHILEGTIDVTGEETYLFTSVEYEEGMKVYVDDKEVQPDILLGSLIGLNLSEGKHSIIIDYTPKGFKTGLIVSSISLVITCCYLQKKKNAL